MLLSHIGEYLKIRYTRRVVVRVGNKFGTFASHSPPACLRISINLGSVSKISANVANAVICRQFS